MATNQRVKNAKKSITRALDYFENLLKLSH